MWKYSHALSLTRLTFHSFSLHLELICCMVYAVWSKSHIFRNSDIFGSIRTHSPKSRFRHWSDFDGDWKPWGPKFYHPLPQNQYFGQIRRPACASPYPIHMYPCNMYTWISNQNILHFPFPTTRGYVASSLKILYPNSNNYPGRQPSRNFSCNYILIKLTKCTKCLQCLQSFTVRRGYRSKGH